MLIGSSLGMIQGLLSCYLKSTKSFEHARKLYFYSYFLLVALNGFVLAFFFMGYAMIQRAKEEDKGTTKNIDRYVDDATIMLAVLAIIGIFGVTGSQLVFKNTFKQFGKFLKELSSFLNDYQETPRSKLIKKYIPPMQPLVEDQTMESRRSSYMSQYIVDQ
jgi:hypothetical protein